jgi:hypothetical protein
MVDVQVDAYSGVEVASVSAELGNDTWTGLGCLSVSATGVNGCDANGSGGRLFGACEEQVIG